jgi:hypothetical protein
VHTTIAHPSKIVGRVVLGPRQVRSGYARIVAKADGSGHIQLFDSKSGAWHDALERCTFSELWSAEPVFDKRYFSGV